MKLPGFGGAPSPPPAPPPPPTREDPAIAESKRKRRLTERLRRGRAASVKVGNDGLGAAPVTRPEARSAQVLGG